MMFLVLLCFLSPCLYEFFNCCFFLSYVFLLGWSVETASPLIWNLEEWSLEGGAEGAIQKYTDIIGDAPSNAVNGDGAWILNEKCDTLIKQKTIGMMLATNVKVDGCTEILQ